ncbi:MAG: pseudaminic acid cytidylyltransferase [Gammaproteobacteria bacterium]|nr:pseudaminic acid cytidylyltransferase [Gammaproteobacteria bacterium]
MRLAVIPARGGSQRIPRKNIRFFLDKPIIAYSIEAARASACFDHIVVSTDDEEIAGIARQLGAEVPFMRPAELADAHTGTNAVVRHAIEWHKNNAEEVTFACCIYATAPFVTAAALRRGFDVLQGSGKSYAFSVTSFPFPVQRAMRRHPDGSIEAMYPEFEEVRSQDLEEAFQDAGQFYWGTAEAFLAGQRLFGRDSLGVVLPRHLVQDIDTEEDWIRAEHMYRVAMEPGPAC